ncbi:MAG: hypothetical protein FWC40_07615 [Proteobacteria bacterium]|nr:hypothetical protein [Pseudomonadota bacterium]
MEREELKKDNGGLDSAHANQREAQGSEYSVAPRTPGGGGRSGSGAKSSKGKTKAKATKATDEYLAYLRDAVTNADIKKLEHSFRNASEADAKAHAKDAKLMRDFLTVYTTSSQDLEQYLDKLYADIVDRALLMECFHRRFGVPVSDGQAKWTRGALRRLYKNYIDLPANQRTMVKDIITDSSTAGSSGWADSNGTIELSYSRGNLNGIVGSGYCDKKDYMYKLNAFDATQLHETGHQVDKWTNARTNAGHYSGSRAFMKISDWKFEGKDSKKVAKTIHDYADKPYAKALSLTEKKIAMQGAEKLVDGEISSEEKMKEAVEEAYNDLGYNTKGDMTSQGWADKANSMTSDAPVGYRKLSELTRILNKSKFYKHIISSMPSKNPWDRGNAVSGMERQIHKAYPGDGKWYSFSNDAYKNKLSRYQFCAPGEEFAELFASYHISKGKAVGLKHKKWFEDKGLHDGGNHYNDDPSNTSV